MSMVSGFLLFDLVEFYAGFNVAGVAYLNKIAAHGRDKPARLSWI